MSHASGARGDRPPTAAVPSFDDVYGEHFDFVWWSVQRLGVPTDSIDDVVQDVFVVVHRKLGTFAGRSSLRSWLYGIVRKVASNFWRTRDRRGAEPLSELEIADEATPDPFAAMENAEELRLLHALLMKLDRPKREVFVLAELEQMTAPEISDAIGIKLNTVYSRLRTARAEFERALERHRERTARDEP